MHMTNTTTAAPTARYENAITTGATATEWLAISDALRAQACRAALTRQHQEALLDRADDALARADRAAA
jgi:hypothetical protein